MSNVFLEADAIVELTGRKLKSKQIEALRVMGLPFFVNATGHPVVARCVAEGKKEAEPIKRTWVPKVLKAV